MYQHKRENLPCFVSRGSLVLVPGWFLSQCRHHEQIFPEEMDKRVSVCRFCIRAHEVLLEAITFKSVSKPKHGRLEGAKIHDSVIN